MRPSARIHLDSSSVILQESMDSCYVTLYDELKYLRKSIKSLSVLMLRIFARMDSRRIYDPGTGSYHPYADTVL